MIGAVVLVAAAIILIPEMLSGPHSSTERTASEPQLAPSTVDTAKLKSYTIDLSKPQGPVMEAPVQRVANPESGPDATPDLATSKPSVVSAPMPEPEKAAASQEQSKPEQSQSEQAKLGNKAAPKSPPLAAAISDTGWTVQVGSFGVRATSDRIATDLRQSGFPAFVVAFQSGSQTMYRVRVGPTRDRAAAETLMQKLKGEHPNATLVAPP